jgi:hypothetical protein
MTHPLLEQLAVQRQDVLAARVRANRPTVPDDTAPVSRRTTTRPPGSLSRLVALVSRA